MKELRNALDRVALALQEPNETMSDAKALKAIIRHLKLLDADLRAAIARQDKPVEWLDVIGAVGRGWYRTGNTHKQMDPDLAFSIADEVKALYTAPPKAAPMTEEEIRELSAKHIKSGMFKGAPATWGIVDFAREIEARKAKRQD